MPGAKRLSQDPNGKSRILVVRHHHPFWIQTSGVWPTLKSVASSGLEACRREAVIRSLIESGPVSHARADLAAEDLGISRALIYRLASRYRLRAQTSSLLPSRRGRAPRSRLLDPAVEAIICTIVQSTVGSRLKSS
jgi:hypothetical protein